MKTMYRAEVATAQDCEGRRYDWAAITEYTTEAEARKATEGVTNDFPRNGDWRIVARTMDEATFTVTDTTVAEFNWWREVGRKADALRMVEYAKADLAKAMAIKARTEKGEARKAKAVAEAEKRVAYYEARL